ncbi:MAG: cyclase family protein [Myxococcales bacterium]|nr:cyclase family protein [Myxococcales bacterium]
MSKLTNKTSELIDLSHRIYDGLITYKGLPAPIICDYLSREESKAVYGEDYQVHIGKVELITNTGTYLDSPFHFDAEGDDLADLPLHILADLPALVIDASDKMEVGLRYFKGLDLSGKAVLVKSNWSKHWNTEQYFEDHAYITAEAAVFLVEQGVKLVGIDSHNIDDTRRRLRPVHKHLLGNNVLICEHMTNLDRVPHSGARFFAVPPKITGVGTFPVRAFAQIPSSGS